MKHSVLIALVGAMFLALWATPASALATQTWVSGVGDDLNLCSRTAPCKTFAGALVNTAPGGEIDCLSPGDFRTVTISQSVTIDCETTSNGGLLVTNGNGITITAGTVTLRGLDINGLGSVVTGVSITGGTVNIQDSKIYGFATGVSLTSAGTLVLTNTRITNNGVGVAASGSIVLRDDIIDDNSGNGITASASATVDRTVLAFNGGVGLDVNASGAFVLLGNSSITGNATGVSVSAGHLYSFKNNQIGGNTNDGTPITGTVLTLSVSTVGSGTVTSSDSNINCGSTCSAPYLLDQQVSLTATPASGWSFSGWSGACSGSGGCTVTVSTGATSAIATFTQNTYQLSASETGSGTVTSGDGNINCGSTCSASYLSGTQVSLTATPASGWAFAGWGGACGGTAACSVTMNAATSVSATFTQNIYPLSVAINGNGSVTSSPPGINCGSTCSANYASGAVVSLTQSAASGVAFAGWSGACSGVGTCIVTMSQAQSVTGKFASGSPPTSPLVAAVLPASRSATVGNPVTAFATIINSGSGATPQCAIAPEGDLPLNFVYQTTNPATNGLIGTANTPVDIAAGQAQSFVIAFTPTAAFAPVQVPLSFACSNVPPAPIVTGLNTLLLSSSTTPVPDIVALAGTASNDGILHIPGASAAGAFAVATVNVGAADTITATANTGSVQLPLSISLCETDPASGQCITTIGASAAVAIAANATPTFAIFGQANGAIPFDPANNRIVVQFTDSGGTVRGATSVAVETQ